MEAGGSPEPSPAAGGYAYLQTGAFAYRENASRLYNRIRQAGISGVYLRRKGNGVYAVWVGPLDDARHAARLRRQLANIGISGTVRVQGVAPPG
ncbi:MAG: SPOR domain-containing protein [Gammaproteobacteria bacterium]|nr:SPOR domain-containing protein [Gammaproteobacteria bacterium]